jgi:hypothetical protein
MKTRQNQTEQTAATPDAAEIPTAAAAAAGGDRAEWADTAAGTAEAADGSAQPRTVEAAAADTDGTDGGNREAAERADTAPPSDKLDLTPEERGIVLRYAVRDPEIRKTIVGEYLKTVQSEARTEAPRILSGDTGNAPALPPRTPRSLFEAGQIVEAMFSRA